MFQPRPTTARLVAISLLALSATSAGAQAPANAPPAAPPPSIQAQSAIKLAGLVAFVANSCPRLQPDYARFTAAISALGVSKADLDKPDLKAAYIGYAARYSADAKTSCERAETQFGPHGATLAGIFAPK